MGSWNNFCCVVAVMQSWFSVQAICPLEGTLARVRELMTHPMWTSKNTNFVRALVGAFRGNFQVKAHRTFRSASPVAAISSVQHSLLKVWHPLPRRLPVPRGGRQRLRVPRRLHPRGRRRAGAFLCLVVYTP
jgi:hypothetical protein